MDRSGGPRLQHGLCHRLHGDVARHGRAAAQSSLGRGGFDRWLGHALPGLRALAGRADLGLCRCAGEAGAMIVVLLNVYLALLFILVKMRIVPFNLFWKVSPVIVLLLLLIGLFIPMNWGAPQGTALVVRNSVPIVADVAGEVTEVPVQANVPLKAGDVLFRIDPTPY